MSDLKDVARVVQHAIDAPPFEQLTRRATQRRHRRTAGAGSGVVAVLATVVALTVLPVSQPMVAPEPDARTLVEGADAQVQTTAVAAPEEWAASWASCIAETCKFSAVLNWRGDKVYAPVKSREYTTLQLTGEPAVIFAPATMSPQSFGPDTALLRVTAQGVVQTELRYAPPTQTFTAGEVLTDELDQAGYGIQVLNLKDSTLRSLEPPTAQNIASLSAPVQDGNGRLWAISGEVQSKIVWTDDRGKTWRSEPLSTSNRPGKLAVSSDGQTIAATTANAFSSNSVGNISTLKVSTNAGRTWKTTTTERDAHLSGPAVLDDGTVFLAGHKPSDPDALAGRQTSDADRRLYTVTAGQIQRVGSTPALLRDITGDGKRLYGIQVEPPSTKVAVSTDHGKTWSAFEPR
ncbi:exo-alpha-sialidase [Kribbella antibiotica]|uniref:Exo-alpha-sialidase n=1 Tax=Kribbella antibiotica TaxID=190195 RepID=A0A4R4Z2Z7_9ACTN|nr:sialidase family protein [Kribbella antibiotica]TDD52303.1 exo-alpha-sialidase [Kribbella antibiotica]